MLRRIFGVNRKDRIMNFYVYKQLGVAIIEYNEIV